MPKLAANLSMLFAEVEFLLGHIERLGYAGWIGCEYNPRGDTREGLTWARRYLS